MQVLEAVASALSILWRERMALFVGFLALLVVAALLGREWFAHRRTEETQTRSALRDLLSHRVDPGPRGEYPAIVAAALALHRERLATDRCTSGASVDPACELVGAMHESAALLAQALRDPDPRSRSQRIDEAMTRVRAGLERTGASSDGAVWARATQLARELAAPGEPVVVPCSTVYPGAVLAEGSRHHVRLFGDAGCDPVPEGLYARLLVPSRLRLPPEASARPRPRAAASAPQYHARARRGIAISRVAEVLVAPVVAGGAHRASLRSSRLVQAYFISPDGVLRIWSDDDVDVPYQRLGPIRLWSDGTSYFEPLLSSSLFATGPTEPYIDYGNYGFVRTRCTAFRGSDQELYGAFCTDQTLALSEPLSARRESPYGTLRGSVVLGNTGIADIVIHETSEVCDEFVRDSLIRDDPTISDCEWLKRQLQRRLDPLLSRRAETSTFRSVLQLELGATSVFVVPLERHHGLSTDGYSVLLVSPRLRPTGSWQLFVFVVPLVLAGVLAAVAIARTRAESKRRQEDAVLQNLHVGVLAGLQRADGETIIEAANDRAEELLGVPLQAFGAAEKDHELFRELVDDQRVYPAGTCQRV